ncbi:MAG: hypothetical protein PHE40_07425 [Acidocella sp.]|nr:hypothetical protein [Acidocella sp.]MDD2795667.1 hypothetical protein [Acidocella sp.]
MDLVENIANVLTKIKLRAGKLGELGLGMEKALRDVADVDALEHHIKALAEDDTKVVVLIDDLDLGWDNSDTANTMLLGLLLAADHIASLHANLHPVIFLREDVYTILIGRTMHADKYRNIERIRWNKDSLIEVLEARINHNRRMAGLNEIVDAFNTVFTPSIGATHTQNWLIERTLSRPRELIQLVRYYTEKVDGITPSDEKLKDAEPDYSNWKLDDLCAEYTNQYPALNSVMAFWKTKFFRRKYHFKRTEIEEMILQIFIEATINVPWFNALADAVDVRRFLDILYEIGFIGDFILGGQGGSRTYYSYEESHEPRFDEVQIHPCFRRAVNTVERIRESSAH